MRNNQNLLIAQVVKFLNGNGHFVWRQENNGRIDEAAATENLLRLVKALRSVNYGDEKTSVLIRDIIRKCYRPVPCSIKGVPDVIGFNLTSGRWIAVEVKVGADQLREEQVEFLGKLKKSGGDVWVIRSIESFIHAFQKNIAA